MGEVDFEMVPAGCFAILCMAPSQPPPARSPAAPPEIEPVTAWHPMLVALLETYLQQGYQLIPEFLLTRFPRVFVKQIQRMGGSFALFDAGLWRGEMAGLSLHGVETGVACERAPEERLLYAFSRAFLAAPSALLPLEGEDLTVYHSLYQQVEQFRRLRGDLTMKDLEEIRRAGEELQAELERRWAAKLTIKQRLAGLSPEQLVELVAGLPPEVLEAAAKKRSS
jgi:hypothetical protein